MTTAARCYVGGTPDNGSSRRRPTPEQHLPGWRPRPAPARSSRRRSCFAPGAVAGTYSSSPRRQPNGVPDSATCCRTARSEGTSAIPPSRSCRRGRRRVPRQLGVYFESPTPCTPARTASAPCPISVDHPHGPRREVAGNIPRGQRRQLDRVLHVRQPLHRSGSASDRNKPAAPAIEEHRQLVDIAVPAIAPERLSIVDVSRTERTYTSPASRTSTSGAPRPVCVGSQPSSGFRISKAGSTPRRWGDSPSAPAGDTSPSTRSRN